jgi:Fur family ferric uptake transcriptional regulator
VSLEHIGPALEIFRTYLKSEDLKVTRQREILLRRIFEREEHFSAEDLEDRVKGDGISKATIYRSLELLEKCGLIAEVPIKDDRRMYEHTFGHDPHDHIVCVDCGKVFEFDAALIAGVQKDIAAGLGFVPVGHRLRIEATCEALRKTGHCDRKAIKLI